MASLNLVNLNADEVVNNLDIENLDLEQQELILSLEIPGVADLFKHNDPQRQLRAKQAFVDEFLFGGRER